MNQDFYNAISGFRNLREFQEFMEAASGEQISRGMTDKVSPDSKEQKKKERVVSKEVEKKANGAAKETHYDHIDPEVEEEPMPPPEPIQPGMQVAIGNKEIDDSKADTTKTIPIEISGEKERIKMNPSLDKTQLSR